MAEIKEIYIWIAFFIIVMAAAAYIRYFYQPGISVSVKFLNSSNAQFYPYENIANPISVQNTGSATIYNMSFGLYMDGNLSRIYRISIPPGKAATVNFNFTPSQTGTYNFRFVADPSSLYNIQNRNAAQSTLSVSVASAQAPMPYALFNKTGLLGEDSYNMSSLGFNFAYYLANDAGSSQFLLTPSHAMNSFLYPALGVFVNYGAIKSISLAHAYYKNYSLVSAWVSGLVNPYSFKEAAIGQGLNVTSIGNVTVVNVNKSSSICIWYSKGWTKSLGSLGGGSCAQYIRPSSFYSLNATYGSRFESGNTVIYNYTGFYGNSIYVGQWSVLPSRYLLFQSIAKGSNFTNVCEGNIQVVYNTSYCNTYYLEPHNAIIVKTNALVGMYNLTAWIVTNNTGLANISDSNMKRIRNFNVTGQSAQFVSGFVNTCTINNYIGCYGSNWNYSKLTIGLINGYNSSISLESISCYTSGTPVLKTLNTTIPSGQYATITTPCYQNGTALYGVALGLNVYLGLVYQENGNTMVANGEAQLVR
ncbi:MAG: hypothetical protein KGH64_03915 [Candidatus Micrarchaeota archaeon]|nr:hypothetical protein [Candidatus Micrarchaeota archaeon]MDE1834457.1 hypothetical protein [Candidatus Micrarchaeota archaeon]MDE1859075.1 hypothetical protein [Candidatus Micrarchaeota archaeon]